MPDVVIELAKQGRALNPKDRERLVDLLLDSFDESSDPLVEEAWRLEIRKRVAAYGNGTTELHDEEDVLAEVKRLAP